LTHVVDTREVHLTFLKEKRKRKEREKKEKEREKRKKAIPNVYP
jgi:hypothetical protein